jgi:hypothetical protein
MLEAERKLASLHFEKVTGRHCQRPGKEAVYSSPSRSRVEDSTARSVACHCFDALNSAAIPRGPTRAGTTDEVSE